MCAILGTLGLKKDIRLNHEILKHRGPDSYGIWHSPENEHPVDIRHTRLAILDLSINSNQPLLSCDGRFVFVFNGEIFNFLELKLELQKKGIEFKTDGDTEVLMEGLILEGAEFQLKCNGMWAFCLWDRKEKKALFGRDRFGEKPLYFSEIGVEKLVFSSEMKGLYPFLGGLKANEKINLFIQHIFDYEHTQECVIQGINRLPPGCYATYQGGRMSIKRWWCTLDHLQYDVGNYKNQVEIWREIFLDAVKIRMRSDVRIGTSLSGGLDSSAVFSVMAYITKQNGEHNREATHWQNAFCSRYPESSLDETRWARIAAESVGSPLQEVIINPLESAWSISDALFQVEDPYLTLPLPMLTTYRAISKAGIKVTLDGHGADELFSGYGHLTSAYSDASSKESEEISLIIKSLRSGNYDSQFKSMYINKYKHKLRNFLKRHTNSVKNPMKFLMGKLDWEFINYKLEYEDKFHPAFKKLDFLSKDLYELFHITILPTLLRNYDRYSMASGLEIRMPFLDHRLVSYTFSLPWTSKVGGTYTKRIMRDALKGILTEPIRTRRDKIGWNAPLHEWLQGPLKAEIDYTVNHTLYSVKLKRAWIDFQNIKNPSYSDGEKMWNLLLPFLWEKATIKGH